MLNKIFSEKNDKLHKIFETFKAQFFLQIFIEIFCHCLKVLQSTQIKYKTISRIMYILAVSS